MYVMSVASENTDSIALVPLVNACPSLVACGSGCSRGPLCAVSTRPGAWVTLGKTPKWIVTASSSGPGTAPSGEETGADDPGSLDAGAEAAGVEVPPPLQAVTRT